MSASVPRCGRLDEHEAHEWTRRLTLLPTTHLCPGSVVTEMNDCWQDRDWQEHVAEQNTNFWEGSE